MTDTDVDEIIKQAKKLPKNIRYSYIIKNVDLMKIPSQKFNEVMELIRMEEKAVALKARADAGDVAAQLSLEKWIEGDPLSTSSTIRKGLKGLWLDEENEIAGNILVLLGVLSKERFEDQLREWEEERIEREKKEEEERRRKLEEMVKGAPKLNKGMKVEVLGVPGEVVDLSLGRVMVRWEDGSTDWVDVNAVKPVGAAGEEEGGLVSESSGIEERIERERKELEELKKQIRKMAEIT